MKKPNYDRRLRRYYKTDAVWGDGPHAAVFKCYSHSHGRTEPYVFLCRTYEEAQEILDRDKETCCWCGNLQLHDYLNLQTPAERDDDRVLDVLKEEHFGEDDLAAWQEQSGLTPAAFQRAYRRLLKRKSIVLDASTGKYRDARAR